MLLISIFRTTLAITESRSKKSLIPKVSSTREQLRKLFALLEKAIDPIIEPVFASFSRSILRSSTINPTSSRCSFIRRYLRLEQVRLTLVLTILVSNGWTRLFRLMSHRKWQLWFLLLLSCSKVTKHLLLLLEVQFNITGLFVNVLAIILVDTLWKMVIYLTKAFSGVGGAEILAKSWSWGCWDSASSYLAISFFRYLFTFHLFGISECWG